MEDSPYSTSVRRRFLHRACLGLATAALGGAALPVRSSRLVTGSDTHHVTIALCGRRALAHLPLILAQALGFFEAEGLLVQLLDVGSDEAALAAVSRGDAQLAACAFPLAMAQHARGLAWRSVVLQTRTPQVVLGVSVRDLSGFKEPADLRGKTVGMLRQGVSDLVVESVLRRARLQPNQITWVRSGDVHSLVHRFRAGDLDAVCTGHVRVLALEQQGELRVLADTRSQRGTNEVFGGVMPGTAVCAPEVWSLAHPEEAQKVADGVVHALKWLQTAGPADLNRVVPEAHFEGARAQYLIALDKAREGFSPDGVVTAEGAITALRVLEWTNPQVRNAWIDPSRAYTNEFAQRSRHRFRV